MAVHPPTGPFPPNDGSNIFRRGLPKPTAKPLPPDAQAPAEPTDEYDLDDEDALFGTATPTSPLGIDDLEAALSGVILSDHGDDGDVDQPVSAILLDDTPDAPAGEPVSAELLDDALAETDTRPPVSAADSSIFAGGPLPPATIGSGWLDPAALAEHAGEPTSGDIWSSGGLPKDLPPPAQPPSTVKFDDAADLFAELRGDSPPSDSVWVEAEADEAEDTGRVSESEVKKVLDTARQGGSMPDFDLANEPIDPELIGGKGDAVEFDDNLADSEVDAGSSIFDRLAPAETELVHPSDDIDFNIPVAAADPNQASSLSGRLSSGEEDPEAVAADLFGGGGPAVPADLPPEVFTDPTDEHPAAVPAPPGVPAGSGKTSPPTAKEKGRPSSKVSPPVKRPKSSHDEPSTRRPPSVHSFHDEAPLQEKKRGGVGGVLAGVATGLALGVGGFAVVYMTGLIPNEKKTAVANLASPQGANNNQPSSARVDQLTADLTAANERADAAAADAKKAHDELGKKQVALDAANNQLRAAKEDVAAAKKQAADAMASAEPLKKEAADARKDLDGAKKLAADAAKERDDARAALALAKKDADDKAKAAGEADAKRLDAEKKLKAADDAVAGAVRELKANKLLDENDDASKLPDAVKKLAAVAASGDAKKAAEALVAIQKERDDAKAALAKAEADTKTALAAATKAKADADDKAKAAVAEATTELKKQLADATAKAEAEQKAHEARLKSLEADFASKLAAARAGVVTIVPAEMEADEKANRSYAVGLIAYRGGKYADAQTAFATATDSNPADARYWYFLGLARTQTGTTGADDAFKKGAEMEARNKPGARVIDAALERLSFADKQRVNKYRQ